MSILQTILEKFKLIDLTLVTFFVTLIITFIPADLVDSLQMNGFKNEYQTYISLAMISSGVYLGIALIKEIFHKIYNSSYISRKRAIKYMIEDMSQQEMQFLIDIFYSKEHKEFVVSGKVLVDNGVRTPLENNKIIYLPSNVGDMVFGFSFNLYPYTLRFLNKNLKRGNINIKKNEFNLKK